MDLYPIPDATIVFRSAMAIVAAGLAGYVAARRLPHGIWVALASIAVVAGVVTVPLVPPRGSSPALLATAWPELFALGVATALAITVTVAGHRRRRSRPAV